MSGFPDASRLFAVMDVTWAAAKTKSLGNILLRKGDGGGKRVSAATVDGHLHVVELKAAETAMQHWNQTPLFMVQGGQDSLDQFLQDQGYTLIDPVITMAAHCKTLAKINPPPLAAIPSPEPLALMAQMWAAGGISADRINVMRRTTGPKTYLISRHSEQPGGCAFVAIDQDIAMIHALEVVPAARRSGVGRNILGRAAIWAAENGAKYLSLVTTGENLPAQKLFTGVGFIPVGNYHYRIKRG